LNFWEVKTAIAKSSTNQPDHNGKKTGADFFGNSRRTLRLRHMPGQHPGEWPMSSNIELGNDRVWSSDIRRAEKIGDRGFRKWISEGRFPRPDGNLFGRNFWLRATYEQWRADVMAGRFRRRSNLSRSSFGSSAA
jgi:hypothetical protein